MADYLSEILPKEEKASKKQYYDEASRDLRAREGFSPTTTIPTPGDRPTLGHGHTGARARPGATITRPQAQAQLLTDMRERIPDIKRSIPRFEEFDLPTQKAITSAWFRGALSGSPNTLDLINRGLFQRAGDAYVLNGDGTGPHAEMARAVRDGRRGIIGRMNSEAESFRNARYRVPVDEPAGPKFGTGQLVHPTNR